MGKANDQFFQTFGGRIRLRVCGICIENDRILLAGHDMPGRDGLFWAPPGGGVQFGETLSKALEREFCEETGLDVNVGDVLFMHEFVEPPLHALELFFEVRSFSGIVSLGGDPELPLDSQIINEVRFMAWDEICLLREGQKHQLFRAVANIAEILQLKGIV